MRLWAKNAENDLNALDDEELHSDKAVQAYRTISEVAEHLHLPQHVLRFWETKFPQIKPLKRGGGRRFYKPEDVDFLRGIRHLLYSEGYTIKGVQKLIKSNGVRAIQLMGQPIPPTPQHLELHAERIVPVTNDEIAQPIETISHKQEPVMTAQSQLGDLFSAQKDVVAPDIKFDLLDDSDGFSDLQNLVNPNAGNVEIALSSDGIKQLQATLFTLLECKKILDSANQNVAG